MNNSTPRATVSKAARYPHIDALRAIAALLVVCLHVTEVFARLPLVKANGDALYQLANAMDMGRLGVVIFFAISGFVICPVLKGPRRTATQEFVIKRFFRLYPAFWLAVPLGLWAEWYLWGRVITPGLIGSNLTMMPSIFEQPYIMGLFWTLETELVFYALCLAMFWLKLRNSLPVFAALCLLLMMIYGGMHAGFLPKPQHFGWQHMPYHIAIMFWGGMARICHDNQNAAITTGPLTLQGRTVLIVIAFFMLAPFATLAVRNYLQWGKAKELQLLAAYSLGLLIFYLGCFHIKLRHPMLIWLGSISYSIYLFHSAFFSSMYWWARNHQDHPLAQLHMSIYLAITIVLSVAFAHIVYRYIESPCNQLARNWVIRLRQAKGAHSNG